MLCSTAIKQRLEELCGVIGGDEHFAPANIAERFWEICERRDEVELRYE